ncbi:MAG: c-type cytochrome [Microthrixaceae bacterium]
MQRHPALGLRPILVLPVLLAASMSPIACGGTETGSGSETVDKNEADLVAGEQTYMDFCGSCHGRDFDGSAAGPSQLDAVFAPDVTTDEDFRTAITEGAPERNYDFTAMPAIGSLDDAEIENVIAYIRSVQQERGFND